MADEQNNVAVDQVKDTEVASTQETESEKTVTVAEMMRRLNKANEEHERKTQEAIEKALEQYKTENELSGKELEEYRRQVAEAEKQALLDEIADLKKEQTKRELTDEAIKTLSGRKLPVNDKVLSFVVKDTADDTLKAIAVTHVLSKRRIINDSTSF